ncbi:MAG: arylsulfotransferase family protein [Planctomycetota bacterium]
MRHPTPTTSGRRASSRLLATLAGLALAAMPPAQADQLDLKTKAPQSEGLEPAPGWTIELTTTGRRVIVRDLQGQLVKVWSNPLPGWAFAELVKPLSDGRLLALIFDLSTLGSPPHRKRLVEIDWDNNILWQYDPPPGTSLHHDFQRLPNGNTLVLLQRRVTIPAISAAEIWDDVIVEVDRGGNAVWEWSCGQNYDKFPLSTAQRNYLATKPGRSPKVIFHLNSVQAMPDNPWWPQDPSFTPGNLLVSFRELNLVMTIDKGTGDVGWFLMNQVIGPHHPRLIPMGTPGAGNILVFDNGGSAGAPPQSRSFSRVIEVDPIAVQVVWFYACVPSLHGWCSEKFYTQFQGGAQRLANGNTLITDSDSGRVFEVNRQRWLVWENRTPGEQVYRAYRFHPRWPNGSIPEFIW